MGDVYLVTGGAASSAPTSSRNCCGAATRVRILDNFSTGRRGNLDAVGGDVEVFEGDIRSYERAHNAVKGADYVIHLAALPSVPRSVQDPLTTNEANITGTLNMLLAARDAGVRRVVWPRPRRSTGPTRRCPSARTCPGADLALRGLQARGRAVRARLHTRVRARDGGAALLQRLRPAAGPDVAVQRRGPALHAHRPGGRPAASSTATACSRATSPTWPTWSTPR